MRTQLSMNSTDLPRVQVIDAMLWGAVSTALSSEEAVKELDWLHIGAALSQMVKGATPELVGRLSESAVCSFVTKIKEEVFLDTFGRQEHWQTGHAGVRMDYLRARFASIYWCAIRDFAVKSRRDCLSVFHIPSSVIEVLAESNTSQIIDFCHGNPQLQVFELTCKPEDCLRIACIIKRKKKYKAFDMRINAAKMIKSNHCASFNAFLD